MGSFNHFGDIAAKLFGEAEVILDAFQAQAVAGSKADAAFDEGDLRAGIGPAPGAGPFERRWVSTAAHSVFVEFPTEAHDIFPKNKQALKIPGWAFPVRMVHHPGTEEQPFMRPQETKLQAPFARALKKLLEP